MVWARISLNTPARIKLTPATLALWQEAMVETRRLVPHRRWPETPPLDEDGYWRAPLWHVIALIGPECRPAGQPCSDDTIEVLLVEKAPAAYPGEPPQDRSARLTAELYEPWHRIET